MVARQLEHPSSQARTWPALVTLCAILFLTFLDNTIVSVTLASIQTTLHSGITQLQWIVDGYLLAFAGLMLTGGTLGDLLGRKKVMLAGVAVKPPASHPCLKLPRVGLIGLRVPRPCTCT